jgi:hypothetical protein
VFGAEPFEDATGIEPPLLAGEVPCALSDSDRLAADGICQEVVRRHIKMVGPARPFATNEAMVIGLATNKETMGSSFALVGGSVRSNGSLRE